MKDYAGKYIFPPRPEVKSPPSGLGIYERRGFIAQPKLNGSCCVVITDGQTVKVMGRHNNFLTREIVPKEDLRRLHRGAGWMVLVGEYMNKSQRCSNRKPFTGFVIFDILAINGKHLIGTTFMGRQELLEKHFPYGNSFDEYISNISPSVYRVHNFVSNFDVMFKSIVSVEMYEGFVLKRPDGRLENGLREANNTGWQLKIRKPTRNYRW